MKDAGIPEAVVTELAGRDSEAMSAHYPHVGTEALAKGTVFFGINQAGTLAGYYVDSNNVNHGLLVTGE